MSRHWACCLEWFRLICHHGHLFYFSISNLKIHYCGCVFSYYLLFSIETSKYSLNIYSNIQLRIWPIKKWIIKILTTKPKYISFHKLKIICLILGFFYFFIFFIWVFSKVIIIGTVSLILCLSTILFLFILKPFSIRTYSSRLLFIQSNYQIITGMFEKVC